MTMPGSHRRTALLLILLSLVLVAAALVQTAVSTRTVTQAQPWLAVQTVDLGALTIQPFQESVTIALDHAPVAGSALLVSFAGFRVPRLSFRAGPAT